MAITRSIAKKQNTNEQVGLQLLYESNRISAIIRIGSFRPKQNNSPPISPPQLLQKRGKQNSNYKTDGTEIWQCRGGTTVTFASNFSGFLFTTAQHAYLLRIFTEVWQQILSNHKGRKGKASQQGILSHLTAEARIEVKSSMVRKSDNIVFLRQPHDFLSTVIASSHLCFCKTPNERNIEKHRMETGH